MLFPVEYFHENVNQVIHLQDTEDVKMLMDVEQLHLKIDTGVSDAINE